MKIAIIMHYDRQVAQFGDISSEINKMYCLKHGYSFITSNEITYKNRPVVWERFPILLKHIKNFDYVVWIDADAFFYNCSPPLEEIINRYNKDILFSADVDRNLASDSVNAGFFILKNTTEVINILNRWAYDGELANRFMNEVGPELEYWIEDQAMIRGCLRYNIDNIRSISKVLPYMELQHFHLHEYEILKRHNILPYVYHAAGKNHIYRYHVCKLYLEEISGNPLSPFLRNKFQDRSLNNIKFKGEQKI